MFVTPVLGVMVYVCDPNTRELRQKNHESEDSLGYGGRFHTGLEKWEGQLNKTAQKLNNYKALPRSGS